MRVFLAFAAAAFAVPATRDFSRPELWTLGLIGCAIAAAVLLVLALRTGKGGGKKPPKAGALPSPDAPAGPPAEKVSFHAKDAKPADEAAPKDTGEAGPPVEKVSFHARDAKPAAPANAAGEPAAKTVWKKPQ